MRRRNWRVRLCRTAGMEENPAAGEGPARGKARLCRVFCCSFSFFFPSLDCGCCPARAAGRLPGAGHGVRGEKSPLHPLHPRTPLFAVTRNLSLESGRTPPAACRVGRRREPSPACGRGDVRACSGAPSALRASEIAFAPAPALHQSRGRRGSRIRQRGAEGRRRRCGRAAVSAGEIGRVRLCRAAGKGRRSAGRGGTGIF